MDIKSGIIIRAISGFYYVRLESGVVLECKARGLLKKNGISPLVGDIVDVSDESTPVIIDIRNRKNFLIRPTVANIDNLIIVLSASHPKPDYFLCDKLIILCLINKIKPVICINKYDEKYNTIIDQINYDYGIFDPIYISALKKENLDVLKDIIRNSKSAFAGQSAVGKTSIMNSLFQNLNFEIGVLSKKSERGRHTTRKCELVYLDDYSGFLIDTPGFSSFDEINIKPDQLKLYYPEFIEYNNKCRFTSCIHVNEPDCAVKEALENGLISKNRYERYLKLIDILKERMEKKYD